MYKYFEKTGSTKTSNYNQAPRLVYDNAKIKLNFRGDLLKQDKVTYIYIVYWLTPGITNSGVTLENCVFGTVKLTKEILILININILDMVLDLIQKEVLHIQVVDIAKMLLLLGLI